MRPLVWNPPVELSAKEEKVAKRIRKAKLFVFLRQIRHELFDAEFQTELATVFKDSSVGLCPVPPAQLALAIILQAYTGVSDDEAMEAIEMDRRWQLVLDCLDCEQPPFGKGTLVRFRALLMSKSFDRRLIEKTICMAQKQGDYNSRSLKVALDSSPLWGAARVEDTYNLLGHALRKTLMVRAVGVTKANTPEASVTIDIESDLNAQQITLENIEELQIDRAYLVSHWVKERIPNMTIVCKAWKVRNGQFFDKNAFVLDWENYLIRCPNGVSLPFAEGTVVHFPKHECQACPIRSQCTESKLGRSISIHPDESLLVELRERQTTESGRAKLRERVRIEHTLAHISQWQGDQARYIGLRKNLFDLRRMAVVHNLHVLARMSETHAGEISHLTNPQSA